MMRGLQKILDYRLLSNFDGPELQIILSGSMGGEIDASELKQYTSYKGGYSSMDRNIVHFWNIMEKKFTNDDKKALLKFVTSCPRPPPWGFAYCNPPFTIARVGLSQNEKGTLPSASTCFNVLKLPAYNNENLMMEKLRYVIHLNAGFENI